LDFGVSVTVTLTSNFESCFGISTCVERSTRRAANTEGSPCLIQGWRTWQRPGN